MRILSGRFADAVHDAKVRPGIPFRQVRYLRHEIASSASDPLPGHVLMPPFSSLRACEQLLRVNLDFAAIPTRIRERVRFHLLPPD